MIKGITHIMGVEGGPKVCIMGALHGNEKVGGIVVEKLIGELEGLEIFGEVYLVIGNPLAYEKGIRFVDTDINRLFVKGTDFDSLGDSVEEKRVKEVVEVLEKSDYLLDLHSTIKPSTAFAYCEGDDEHVELAKLLGGDYIVSPAKEFRPQELVSSADNYVDRHYGIGITLESGWCEDMDAVDDVLEGVKKFLQSLKVYDFGFDLEGLGEGTEHLQVYDHVVPESDKFMFSNDYSGFDFVKAGEVVASDNGEAITVEKDSYIIFPKKDIVCGKAACYLAQKL